MHLTALLLAQLPVLILGTPVDRTAHNSLTTRTNTTTTTNIPFPFDDTDDNIKTLGAALDFLANIPADNTTTQEGVRAWAHAHQSDYFITNGTSSTFAPKQHHPSHHKAQQRDDPVPANLEARLDFLKIAACAAEIAKVILENAIPFGELLKIKRLIEALGGAYKVAKLLVKARSLAELMAISTNMEELVGILLGIGGIVGACGLHS